MGRNNNNLRNKIGKIVKAVLKEPENVDESQQCFVCKKTFKQLLRHLSLSEPCKDNYPLAQILRLRLLSKKRVQNFQQNYYSKNKTDILKKRKAYHATNKEQVLKKRKIHHSENKPKILKKKKIHYVAKRSKILKGKKKNYAIQNKKRYKNFPLNKKLFFKEIQHGPIFPCICCNRDMFERGVKIVTEQFRQLLNENDLNSCVRLDPDLKINGNHYICSSCHSTLKNKKKMPPICFNNGLGLSDVPECLKLTTLENHLISKNLVFIMVSPSPRSRYDKMHNRIVNVPIPDDDVVKTVTTLPRQGNSSGLINVQLKRKLEYKNVHL